jgi:hypothetical protein
VLGSAQPFVRITYRQPRRTRRSHGQEASAPPEAVQPPQRARGRALTPPPAVPPDRHREEYTFTQLGVRVPCLLVSPYADRTVSSTTFDHTSLLKDLIDKWGLGALGERTAHANSIAPLIRSAPRPEAELPGPIRLSRAATLRRMRSFIGQAAR